MKGVIYARYSSNSQREESIEGQIRECKAYAEHNDITIVGTYIDRAMSAKTDNRPDFQKMVNDSTKGKFGVIIVWKLDRFARNRYDSAHYKHLLKKKDVRVLSARENIAAGPEGILLESLLEGLAEYYSAELSEKVIRGHKENALKCKYNGGTPTFGFYIDSDKNYQINANSAPVVLDIFKRYSKGSTMKEIVDHLNKLGVHTVKGKAADLNFVSRILKNRKYIGEYGYRDIVIPNGIPKIISEDLFDRVQEQLEKNKRAPARHKAEDDYLLTTKLFCGTCKSFMVGESGTSSSKAVYRYYRCVNSKKKKSCTALRKSIKKVPLENAVINAITEKITDDAILEYIADSVIEIQNKESSELPLLRKQLADTEKGIANMLNAIQAGIITDSTKQRVEELEANKKELETNIAIEELQKPMLTKDQILFWLYKFRKLDVTKLESRRRFVDSFVNSIVVYDDYILITFNYKDGTKTVTFKEIESSDLSSLAGPKSPNLMIRTFSYFIG